jgi:hypothetical protein
VRIGVGPELHLRLLHILVDQFLLVELVLGRLKEVGLGGRVLNEKCVYCLPVLETLAILLITILIKGLLILISRALHIHFSISA